MNDRVMEHIRGLLDRPFEIYVTLPQQLNDRDRCQIVQNPLHRPLLSLIAKVPYFPLSLTRSLQLFYSSIIISSLIYRLLYKIMSSCFKKNDQYSLEIGRAHV